MDNLLNLILLANYLDFPSCNPMRVQIEISLYWFKLYSIVIFLLIKKTAKQMLNNCLYAKRKLEKKLEFI